MTKPTPGRDAGTTIYEETQQEPTEDSYPVVSVNVVGPVRTQPLPSPGTTTTIRRVLCPADGSAVNVSNHDLRRRTIQILSTDSPFYLSTDKSNVDGGSAPLFPINVFVTVGSTTQLYAKTGTADTQATLSVIEEDWTE